MSQRRHAPDRREFLQRLTLPTAALWMAGDLPRPVASAAGPKSKADPAKAAELQRRIEQAALLYFRENTHPRTGLVRVVANNFSGKADGPANRRASIAATGYGLAVMTNAVVRQLVPATEAKAYADRVLSFALEHQAAMTRRGWWLHFADWATGARLGTSEFSTIDTAWFVAGALYAGAVFKGTPLADKADTLLAAIDFPDMLTDGGARPDKLTLTLSFTPEKGYSRFQWDHYAEDLVLKILGLGHPTHPLPPATWAAWIRQKKVLPNGKTLIGFDRALFTHQYAFQYLDLRGKADRYANYYDNAVLANSYNRAVCLNDPKHRTFQLGFWGLSAGSAPGGRYRVNTPEHYDGTACISAAVAAAMFDQETVLGDVDRWLMGPYGDRIWGRYGLADGVNFDDPAAEWVAPDVHGITVGPEFLAFANSSPTTAIGPVFNEIPAVKRGLEVAFEK